MANYTSDVDKSNALNKFFSSVFTNEDPSTAPTFNIDKSDDVSLYSITIDPSIVFEKLASLKIGMAPGPEDGQQRFSNSVQISYASLCLSFLTNP